MSERISVGWRAQKVREDSLSFYSHPPLPTRKCLCLWLLAVRAATFFIKIITNLTKTLYENDAYKHTKKRDRIVDGYRSSRLYITAYEIGTQKVKTTAHFFISRISVTTTRFSRYGPVKLYRHRRR